MFFSEKGPAHLHGLVPVMGAAGPPVAPSCCFYVHGGMELPGRPLLFLHHADNSGFWGLCGRSVSFQAEYYSSCFPSSHAVSTVSGVNPNINYPGLYRVFAELWIYMGLAWLSLFFSWNVNMVVEAHKVLKKRRRQRHRHFYQEEPEPVEDKDKQGEEPDVIDIFNFPKEDDYSTVIKQIGATAQEIKGKDNMNRSKSCSDILSTNILTLDQSPRHRRMISISEVFVNSVMPSCEQKEVDVVKDGSSRGTEDPECARTGNEENEECGASEAESHPLVFPKDAKEETSVQRPHNRALRFQIYRVQEEDMLLPTDNKTNDFDKDDIT